MKNPIVRFFSEPLVQFLIIGAGIYAAYATLGTPEEESADTKILVDEARISAYITEWESRGNRSPTQEEVEGLIQNHMKEEVLYRQAVAMGLGEDDPITRRRIAIALIGSLSLGAVEQDTQFWFPVQVVHPFDEAWTVSMQAEIRLDDDMSDFSELVLKPAVNYHFNEHWALSLGYKYIAMSVSGRVMTRVIMPCICSWYSIPMVACAGIQQREITTVEV